MTAVFAQSRLADGGAQSLGDAAQSLGLPPWTRVVFGGVPLAFAVTVALRPGSSLPFLVVVALLAVAVAAIVFAEFVSIPEPVVGLAGMAALAAVASGGDRLSLVIAAWLVLRGTSFASVAAGVAILTGAIGLTVAARIASPGLPGAPFVVVGMCVAFLTGTAARIVIQLVQHMHEAEQLLADEAAREDRRRLAREVHDVIAHSMTVTLLHVNGARLAIHDDPEAAERALEQAERVGRASLEDLRRTVRLLSARTDPTPGTSIDLRTDLERLREGFAGAAHMSLEVTGDADDVPPFVALTVFRIVQESLTNALRHAPSSCVRATVDVDDDRVSLRVENSRGERVVAVGGSGRGLRGMFERAVLLGGHLAAGPTKDGWVVEGWVPREVASGVIET
jgi:signal transduction histidine kinase